MANNTVKPKGEGWSAIINGVEVKQVNGGLMLGSGLDAVFIHGDKLRLVDPTTKMQGHYPDNYPFTAPHDHVFDEENIDLVLDRTYPYDGIPLELLPKAIRDLKGMLLGNVSIKANFPTNEITGEYTGTLQKGDLVTWDTATGEWVAATCPVARGLTDNALFTGVAFPDSDEILSASNVVCDAWDLTPGQAYYLDCANPGKMTDQDTGYYVGVAQSKTAMYFAPYASSVEQVITKLQEQVSAVDTAMQDLQSAFEGVQTTVEEMQAIVEEVKANDDQVNQKLQDLATQAQTTNGQLVDALTRIGQLEATDATHQTYFNSIASQFQTVSTTISNMASSLSQSDEEIRQNAAKMRQELDAINELLSQGAGKWAELVQKHEDDINAINDKLGDCTCESITAKFEEQAAAIQTNTDAHNALQTAYDAHIADYQELKDGHNVLYGQVQEDIANLATANERIDQNSARIAKNESDIGNLKQKDIELKAAIDGNTGLITANENRIIENKAAIESVRSDFTAHATEYQGHLEGLNQRVAANTTAIAGLGTADTSIKEDLLAVSVRVHNIENMLDEVPDGSGCTCDFTQINENISKNAASISALETTTANNSTRIGTIEQKIESGEIGGPGETVDLTPLTNRVTANEEAIQALQNADKKVEDFLGFTDGQPPVSEEGKSLVEEINSLDEKLSTVEGSVTTVTEKVTELETKVGAIDTAAIAKDIEDLKAADQSLDTRVTALEAGGGAGSGEGIDLTPITSRLTAVETKNTEQDTAISALQAALNGTEAGEDGTGGTTGIADQISTIQTSVGNLQSSIASIANLNTAQDGRLTALENGQSENSASIGTLQDSLSDLQTKQTTCCDKVTSIENTVEELQTTQTECCSKVTKLEGAVAELTADVESIKDVVDTSGGGTVTRVVTAPEFTLPNFLKGETVSITFTSSSLLQDGSVASIKVRVPALSIDQTLTVTDGSATISLPLGDTEAGTVIAVSAYAVDNLGNTSEIVTKSGTVLEKAVTTPIIVSVTGQDDLWESGIAVTVTPFGMDIGEGTYASAIIKIVKDGYAVYNNTFGVQYTTDSDSNFVYVLPSKNLRALYDNGGNCTVEFYYIGRIAPSEFIKSPTATKNITVIGASITTPTLSSPVANAEIDKSGSLIVTTSAFAKAPANAPVVHTKTDYKVTSDAAGNNVVLSAMDSADLTSHTFTDLSALAEDATYYVWARHHGSIE